MTEHKLKSYLKKLAKEVQVVTTTAGTKPVANLNINNPKVVDEHKAIIAKSKTNVNKDLDKSKNLSDPILNRKKPVNKLAAYLNKLASSTTSAQPVLSDEDRQYIAQRLKQDEGFRSHWYKDPSKKEDAGEVIGYGFGRKNPYVQQALKDVGFDGSNLSKEQADKVLDKLINRDYSELVSTYPWVKDAPQPAKYFMSSGMHQLGASGLGSFEKTLNYLSKGDYENAATEMLDSKWAKSQTPARAKRISDAVRAINTQAQIKQPTTQTTTPVVTNPTPSTSLSVTANPSESTKYHTVAKGNTFSGLDKQYGLPYGSFQKANPSVNPKTLQIGSKLTIPNK